MARLPKATDRFEMRITPMELIRWKRWARLRGVKLAMLVREALQEFGRRVEKKAG